jgi:hypothetical protein
MSKNAAKLITTKIARSNNLSKLIHHSL